MGVDDCADRHSFGEPCELADPLIEGRHEIRVGVLPLSLNDDIDALPRLSAFTGSRLLREDSLENSLNLHIDFV